MCHFISISWTSTSSSNSKFTIEFGFKFKNSNMKRNEKGKENKKKREKEKTLIRPRSTDLGPTSNPPTRPISILHCTSPARSLASLPLPVGPTGRGRLPREISGRRQQQSMPAGIAGQLKQPGPDSSSPSIKPSAKPRSLRSQNRDLRLPRDESHVHLSLFPMASSLQWPNSPVASLLPDSACLPC
jgi:hypothetical protein